MCQCGLRCDAEAHQSFELNATHVLAQVANQAPSVVLLELKFLNVHTILKQPICKTFQFKTHCTGEIQK